MIFCAVDEQKKPISFPNITPIILPTVMLSAAMQPVKRILIVQIKLTKKRCYKKHPLPLPMEMA